MPVRYRFDPAEGRFTVQAFATGMLSALGHSPTFAVRDYAGDLRLLDGEIRGLHLELTVRADSLDLQDRVGDADRREILRRMRDEVLETAAYPEITYRASRRADEPLAAGRYRLRLGGPLSLHGATRDHQIEAELLVFGDGLRLRGSCPLRMSDFSIRPVTALAGAIKLKDELRLTFDVAALLEES